MNADVDGVIPVDESSELAFQLLADWWMDSVQALVDAVGSLKALELLRPHYKNAGISAFLTLKDFLRMVEIDRLSWAFRQKIAFDFLTRADPKQMRSDIREHGGIARSRECPFRSAPPEMCELVCEIAPNASLEICHPEYDQVMTKRLSRGDPECVWLTKPRSWNLPCDASLLGEVKAEILPRVFSKEVVDDFSIQYLAEFWVISSRAFVEQFGETRAASVLNFYMKHSGTSFGLRFRSSNACEVSIGKARECIGHCTAALHMIGKSNGSVQDGWEYTVTECPFKDAPPEVCEEFRSFCEGICESIDPELVFVYDRMMTKGDETCHWTLRKKNEKQPTRFSKPSLDDHVKRLIAKYVEGEISDDDFRRKMEIIRDYESEPSIR